MLRFRHFHKTSTAPQHAWREEGRETDSFISGESGIMRPTREGEAIRDDRGGNDKQ